VPGSDDPAQDITEFLRRHAEGDAEALQELFPIIYADLRRIARARLQSGFRSSATLSTTMLVNEAYVRLAGESQAEYQNRDHFMAVCSKVIRSIAVDYARRRAAAKRGGDVVRSPLREGRHAAPTTEVDLLALDEALKALARHDPRLEQVVECRFFAGMTVEETARTLGVSKRTCERDWTRARAYLFRMLASD
jgi:RNA polymerase sigma factor (TIGR02999 family)